MPWEIYVLRMTRRSIAFDVLLALVVLVAGQAEAWTGAQATHRQGPHWAEALGYGLAAAALVLRRGGPLLCGLLVSGVLAPEWGGFGSPGGMGVMLIGAVAAHTGGNPEGRARALHGPGADL